MGLGGFLVLLASLLCILTNISLSRSASVVGGASLCFMLGATMKGVIGRRRQLAE